MKRLLFVVWMLLALLLLIGCEKNVFSYTVEDTYSGNAYYFLQFPDMEEGERIFVDEEELEYLSDIDPALFASARETILSEAKEDEPPHLSIIIRDGYLILYGEIVRDIEPPETEIVNGEVYSDGCGLDHEHIYFYERISRTPVVPDEQ